MNIVEVRISRAGYKERNEAIQQIQFHIQPGELVGLIGPNGAGKSTTIKAMMGLLKDFEGEITMSRPDSKYAYIPEQPIFYDELTFGSI
ncbi:ATP-binding cassette domain-containing protein [Caldalkalibacillus mannanilyticus]|uniref:ATP-binding cassette domain-containing protein n=1 Tax=Caldalkalibacillus mannanilyticus TaxID=1418 RepID=UPI000ACD82FA